MFISSLNRFIRWHQLQGTIGEKQYFIVTGGYLLYRHGFGMDQTEQELDLAHGSPYIERN